MRDTAASGSGILWGMASYLVEEAAAGLYALAVWDEAFGSYNNCYLLRAGGAGRALLIDSGRERHAPALLAALSRLGGAAEQVAAVVATHRHGDHVGGAAVLPGVCKPPRGRCGPAARRRAGGVGGWPTRPWRRAESAASGT